MIFLTRYKNEICRSRFIDLNIDAAGFCAVSLLKCSQINNGMKADSCNKVKCDQLYSMSSIAQSSASVTFYTHYFHIPRIDKDYNNYYLFFSILISVKSSQMSSSKRDNLICLFNSNESNKGNKRLLQRLINYRNLNIPSNLAACFLGNCKTGNGSVLNNIISESQYDQSDTSIGFPSSIFESRSSFINNDAIVIRQDFFQDRSCNDGFMISPSIVQHPPDNDLLIWRLIPSYEQDARAFCQISVININQCTTSRCVSTQVEKNVIEIECNLDADKAESGRTKSLVGGNEINDVDKDWRRTTRSILRSGDRKYKNYNQLRLTFAPGNNLVTVFEYPGDDSYHSYQQGINENNQYDRVNTDSQPDPTRNQCQQSDGINGNDLSELSIVTVEEGFDSVSTSLLFGMIQ